MLKKYLTGCLYSLFLLSAVGYRQINKDPRFSSAMNRNSKTEKVADAQLNFSSAGDFQEGLASVSESKKYGYIDTTGASIIFPQYDFAGAFSQNRAPVLLSGKWGYINATGDLIIPASFDWAGPFHEGFAIIADSLGHAFMDTNGIRLNSDHYVEAKPFSEGLAGVKIGSEEDGAWGFINKLGEQVIPGLFPDIAGSFSGGLAGVKVGRESAYQTGYIDTSGGFILDTLYDAGGTYAEGLLAVGMGEWRGSKFHGRWGYVDSTGRLVIEQKFSWAGTFHMGMALVRSLKGDWGLIDRQGHTRVTFPSRMHLLPDTGRTLLAFKELGQIGFVDLEGRIKIPPLFKAVGPFRHGYARVKLKSGNWAFINLKGEFLLGRNALNNAYP